jgi:hypothetical protein
MTASTATAAKTTTSRSMSTGGWDNDNFLDSLGGGNNNNDNEEAMDRANEEYFQQSKYGRPTAVDYEESAPSSSAPTSYAESLQQRREQAQQQQRQMDFPHRYNNNNNNNNDASNDMTAVSDAAAEIYAYSYNKNVDAPAAVGTTGFDAPVGNPGGESPLPPLPVQNTEGTVEADPLTSDLVAKIKASHDDEKEEASQGGSRFRELMMRAQDVQPTTPSPPQPTFSFVDDAAITPPSSIMTPEELANLSTEEQARLYREFFYVQQQNKQQQQSHQSTAPNYKSIGSTPDNYLQAGYGFDGRKIGRNRDSDAVSNSGDVYFAQLKKDSTTRNLARYSGDDAKANAIFHDPSIQEIVAPVNPYLEDQQRRMRDVVETIPEEMMVFQEYNDPAGQTMTAEELASQSGVSYKQKMEERRKNQQQ